MTEPEWLQDPESLWHETGLGREEYLQKLLSTLVFGHPDHRWNHPGPPSDRGQRYLQELFGMRFGEAPTDAPEFVDEFELPRRNDDERAGWPDQAAVWPDRLFLIELKTERASHRPGQMAHYIDLAVHHHHGQAVDALYLTPTMEVPPPSEIPDGVRYAPISWQDVSPLISETWGGSEVDWERTIAQLVVDWLEDVEAGTPPPAKAPRVVTAESVAEAATEALSLAAQVEESGDQAALDIWPGSAEELEELRLELRDRLKGGLEVDGMRIRHVLPWHWSAGSSGGHAMTQTGREHGHELRFSRYRQPLWTDDATRTDRGGER
ncbi:MAG: hypothetical protein R3320_04995 [Nitriliruptorales bacterium]|nr:hypothetical protein [Nitriliruptorales bacterium]